MQAIEITQDVLSDFPDAQVRLVAAHEIDSSAAWSDVDHLIADLESKIAESTWKPFAETDPQVASWHEAFRKFGTNPRRSRPSLDALSRRVAKSGVFPRISSPVDAYNYLSVFFGVPAGGFDLDKLEGPITIRRAVEDDRFTPLGQSQDIESPNVGEIVYADSGRVLTRHWNHRDCDQTKVEDKTRNVLFILERISQSAVTDKTMNDAQDALVDILVSRCGAVFRATLDSTAATALLPRVK